MAKYKLTNKAIEDLANIWEYTYDKWSENQADNYYKMLLSNCEEIANNPSQGKKYEEIHENLLGVKGNRHVIFYRKIESEYDEITRILHGRIDLKNRIIE